MKLHANARLSLKGRELLVDRVSSAGWSLTQAAEAAGVSDRTARSGWPATAPRASAGCWIVPRRRGRCRTAPMSERVEVIAALRRLRMTGAEIAECLGMALSTVSGVLTRIGLGKLCAARPLEPPNRYERARPGELIHIDVKKLGRISAAPGTASPATAHSQHADRRAGTRRRIGRLGVRARRDRRRHPPGLRRGPRRREGHHRGRLPAPRGRATTPPTASPSSG